MLFSSVGLGGEEHLYSSVGVGGEEHLYSCGRGWRKAALKLCGREARGGRAALQISVSGGRIVALQHTWGHASRSVGREGRHFQSEGT